MMRMANGGFALAVAEIAAKENAVCVAEMTCFEESRCMKITRVEDIFAASHTPWPPCPSTYHQPCCSQGKAASPARLCTAPFTCGRWQIFEPVADEPSGRSVFQRLQTLLGHVFHLERFELEEGARHVEK